MKKIQLFSAAFLFICMAVFTGKTNAQVGTTFAYTANGNSLNYYITSTSPAQVRVTGGTNVTGDLIIPDSVQYSSVWYKVKTIYASAFINNASITSVTTGNSMDTIYNTAFDVCHNIHKVDLGSGIKYMGSYVFSESPVDTVIIRAITTPTISTLPFFYGSWASYSATCKLFVPTPTGYWNTNTFWQTKFNAGTTKETSNIHPIVGTKFYSDTYGEAHILRYQVLDDNRVELIGYLSGTYVVILTLYPYVEDDYGADGNNYGTNYMPLSGSYELTRIGANAFQNNTTITRLVIYNNYWNAIYGIDTISSQAFDGCTSLHKITLGENIKYLGSRAFYNCPVDTVICDAQTPPDLFIFPSTTRTFSGLSSSAKLIVPCPAVSAYQSSTGWVQFADANIISPATYYFYAANTAGQTIKYKTLTTSTCEVTSGNSALVGHVDIPSSVTNSCGTFTVKGIGTNAFLRAAGITSVTIPNTVTTIGSAAFYYADAITEITLPNSVTTINTSAFQHCANLHKITLGTGVTSIESGALKSSALDTVICLATTPPTLDNNNANAFFSSNYGINLATCKLLKPCGANYNVPGWSSFTNIISMPAAVGFTFAGADLMPGYQGVTTFSYKVLSNTSASSTVAITGMTIANSDWDGALYIPQTTTAGCPAGTNYTITKVTNSAFENNSSVITKVYIPNTVDTIASGAFDVNHSLKYVQLGNSSGTCDLKYIGQWAFSESTLDSMKVYAATPPTCYSNGVWHSGAYGNPNTPVKVPCGTKAAYGAATGWNYFTNFKGMYDSDTTIVNANNLCYGAAYTQNGFTIPAVYTAATYYRTATNAQGCDSVIRLNVTVRPPVDTNFIAASICYGTSYTQNGFNLTNQTASNIHYRYVNTANGCDSTIKLTLTVYPQVQPNVINASICNGQTYTQNGFNVSTAGTHTRTVQNANGCDSTITLILNVLNGGDTTTINASTCYGTTYNGNGFSNLTASGIYHRTETNSSGCQYVIKLVLTVYPQVQTNVINAAICYGQTYTQNGFNANTAGQYTRTEQNANGCDSTIILNLTVYPQAASTIAAAICAGQTYTQNGFNVSTAGTYTRTVQTANGCDSVITLVLSVLSGGDTTTINDFACYGTSYNQNGFSNLTASGIYHRTATNSDGCQYVIKLVLTVYPQAASTINAAICSGQTYTQNGFNVSAAGTYTRVVQNANGCDSTITLILSVISGGDTTHVYDNVCAGSAYINNGFNISNPQTQTYYRTETNSGGCQYVIALHLTINNVDTPSNLVATINNNKIDVSWNGNAEVYELWRNNEFITSMNNNSFTDDQVSAGQQYCYKVKAHTGDCESDFTAETCVTLNSLADVEGWNINVYPNPASEKITVEGEGLDKIVVFDLTGKEIMSVNVTESKTLVNISGLPVGAYTMRIIADNKIVSTKKIIKQ